MPRLKEHLKPRSNALRDSHTIQPDIGIKRMRRMQQRPKTHLEVGDSSDADNFQSNIRQFNSALALASMGAQVEEFRDYGLYSYKIHEQIYLAAGPLHPSTEKALSYGQLYTMDTKQAAEERRNVAPNKNLADQERAEKDLEGIKDFRKHTYIEMPECFTFDKTRGEWKTRKRGGEWTIRGIYGTTMVHVRGFSESGTRSGGIRSTRDYDIDERLVRLGKSIDTFTTAPTIVIANSTDDFVDLDFHRAKGDQLYATLNPRQKEFCDAVIAAATDFTLPQIFVLDEAERSGCDHLGRVLHDLQTALETADFVLRDLPDSPVSFGGKRIVLRGDFRQILPVIRRGTKTDLINNCIKNSYLWNQFQKFSLLDNMRIINADANWIKFLLDVGDGAANDYEDRVTLLEGLPVLEDLVDDVFGGLRGDISDAEVEDESTNKHMTTEFLNSVRTSSLPLHRFRLNVGSVVMIGNIWTFKRKCILYSFAIGSNKGKDTFVPRITCYEDKNLPFHLKRTQFPVKLAFAISINKAQGQSFGRVRLYLPEDVFAHGQTYVALSRARSKNELFIKSTSERLFNVVYKEIL
uniref:ATP-dependent DNA helicase n=1 Tax=Caenorhabditis japonica TaxID=281687 RepID=A0A8R1IC92_CAEJA